MSLDITHWSERRLEKKLSRYMGEPSLCGCVTSVSTCLLRGLEWKQHAIRVAPYHLDNLQRSCTYRRCRHKLQRCGLVGLQADSRHSERVVNLKRTVYLSTLGNSTRYAAAGHPQQGLRKWVYNMLWVGARLRSRGNMSY